MDPRGYEDNSGDSSCIDKLHILWWTLIWMVNRDYEDNNGESGCIDTNIVLIN